MAKSIIKTKSKSKSVDKNDENIKVAKTSRIRCEDCQRVLAVDNFYKDSTTTTGTYGLCISCMRKRAIDSEKKELTKYGLTSLLQMIDKPYIANYWDKLRMSDMKPESKLGSYIRLLNTVQYKGKKFKESDPDWNVDDEERDATEEKFYDYTWKGEYTKRQIEILNKQFESYKKDFVITDVNQEDYTRKICKASLDLDECTNGLRNGTISEQRYKLAKETFDSLSKSAKFAKSEREDGSSLGCFGQVFDLVEKNVWVDSYVPENEDVYDKLISQLSNIERSL